MNNVNNTTVIKIICGDRIGTAFFITDSMLITARHNIVESVLSKEPIYLSVSNNRLEAFLKFCPDGASKGDFAIIEVTTEKNQTYLECLSMPFSQSERYHTFGYPYTILGQSTGVLLDIEIYKVDNIHITEGFDTTAVVSGAYIPTKFTGLSGAPVFNESEKIVGIITHKLDGCVGFISIYAIKELLISENIWVDTDYEKYSQSPYSRQANIAILEKMINSAGPRYMPEVHVEKRSLDKYFEYAIEIYKIKSATDEYTRLVSDVVDMINTTTLDIFKIDKGDCKAELLSCLTGIIAGESNSYAEYLIDITNDNVLTHRLGKLKEEEYQQVMTWNAFYSKYKILNDDLSSYDKLSKSPYLCLTGKAGSGKTHLLCHKAEHYVGNTNVYLCYGTQFQGSIEIEEQLQMIFGFASKDYLHELNDNASSHRVTFIIDAINEGVGYNYWADRLSAFVLRIKKYDKICLIISIRDPFVNKFKLHKDFTIFHHVGHDDTAKAKNEYFKYYNIKETEFKFDIPEFSNGLFLKIFCEAYGLLNSYQRSKTNKLHKLFIAYIRGKESKISDIIDYDNHLRPVENFLKEMSLRSINATKDEFILHDISRIDAHTIGNKICMRDQWSKSLLYTMLSEDILISTIRYKEGFMDMDRIDFAYERLGDFFKAIVFCLTPVEEQNKTLKRILRTDTSQSYNFFVALSTVIPEIHKGKELYDIFPVYFDKHTNVKMAYIDSLKFREIEGVDSVKIIKDQVFTKINDKVFFEAFINHIYLGHKNLDSTCLHSILIGLSQTELNIRWTNSINAMYDDGNIITFYSEPKIKQIKQSGDSDKSDYLIVLCWLLSSSYPIVRDRVTRVITFILKDNTVLVAKIIQKFKDVKDLYILERLICAIYGVVLKNNDNEFIKEVSKTVFSIMFADGTPPTHIHLRQYARLIIERAYHLGLIDEDSYHKSQPPYNSDFDLAEISESKIKAAIGSSHGTEAMLCSIGAMNDPAYAGLKSDFYRYTLGGNNREQTVFTKVGIGEYSGSIGANDYYTVYELAKIISNEVYSNGWTNELGILDENRYSHDRYENKKERLGKKYQWIALYSVLAKLVDNNVITDYWSKKKVEYINPSSIEFNDNFDPSIDLYPSTESIPLSLSINKQNPNFEVENWIDESTLSFDANLLVVVGNDGCKWVRLSGIDTFKEEQIDSSIRKEQFLIYNTYIISKDDLDNFNTWASTQNFYGRWMPEVNSITSFRLLEYMWCSTCDIQEESEVLGECPCGVLMTTYNHLQENFSGFDDDNENRHNTVLPSQTLMEGMNLKVSSTQGVIYDNSNVIAAVDASYIEGDNKGLYIRKDILDIFLRDNNFTLVMPILGSKEMLSGYSLLKSNHITGYCFYDEVHGYKGDIRFE